MVVVGEGRLFPDVTRCPRGQDGLVGRWGWRKGTVVGKRVSLVGSIRAAPILSSISPVWVLRSWKVGSFVCAVGLRVAGCGLLACLALAGSLCRGVAEHGSILVSVG